MRHSNSVNITLSTSFGRRFQKHDANTRRFMEREMAYRVADDVAAFTAAGGKITVLPGFTGVAPRAAVKSPATPDEDPTQWKQAPDLPGYLVNCDGLVWCRASQQFVVPRGNSRVAVVKAGKKTWANGKKLAEIAWSEQ